MELVSSTSGFSLKGSTFAESATITDKRGIVVAEDYIVKLSNTQAYAVICPQASSIQSKAIIVEKEDEAACKLKLLTIEEERSERRLLPVYVQFHYNPKDRHADSHLLDGLVERALGNTNLDLKKNVTADFFQVPTHVRDESGFIVSDKMQFAYLTFDKNTLAQQLKPSQEVTVSRYSSEDLNDLVDLDNNVSGYMRSVYIEELVTKTSTLVAREKGERVVGAIFGRNDRVFALYAESEAIAHALLSQYLSSCSSSKVSLFSPDGIWTGALSSRRVFRRHTRVVPSAIDWTLVYAHNAGVSIV